MGDQSQFVVSSLERVSRAIENGELDLNTLEEQVGRVKNWKHPKVEALLVRKEIDFRELMQGFEISGSVELSSEPINVVEIGTKPTIAAGDVSWGIHRELRMAGIACDIHASDSQSLSSKRLVVAFRDAYRDEALLATLNNLSCDIPMPSSSIWDGQLASFHPRTSSEPSDHLPLSPRPLPLKYAVRKRGSPNLGPVCALSYTVVVHLGRFPLSHPAL